MKKVLLLLAFCSMVGMLPAHAFDFDQEGGFTTFQPYPYPQVLSPAIDNLPQGFNTILIGDETFYYSNGVFYQKIVRDAKYVVVPPPIGAVVFDLPVGYQYMFTNGKALYVSNGVYYKKVLEGYRVTFPPAGV